MRKITSVGILAACAAALVLVGCLAGLKGLRFSHREHASEAACSDCHGASGARARHDACVKCHEIDEAKPSEACRTCHVEGDYKVEAARPASYGDVTFDHDAHDGVACERCHAGASASTRASDTSLPAMGVCTPCHDGRTAPAECATCHERTRRDVRPEDHTSLWPRQHGSFATSGDRSCAYCHSENACQDCHKLERPQSHTPAWKNSKHGIEAEHDRNRCATCHRADECSRCHQMRPPSHFGANFRIPLGDGQGHAGLVGRRGSARSCVACHERSFCLACHPGGL